MLVGRGAERVRLQALLAAARLGQSGVLVVSGEPGIGKTALLDDLRTEASDMRISSVTGTEAERDLPFAGLAQLLRLSPADLERLPRPQAEALGVALALWPGSGVDRFAVGAGLLTLLAEQSETRPLCLVVDDAHQLDQPSQDALLFVARRLIADPIALIIGVRAEEPCRLADPSLPRLELAGLDPAPARALADLTAATPLGGSVVDRVLELSLGNPLAIRELVADPAARDLDPLSLPRSLPVSLTSAYARRVADLSPPAATAARCAAVVGGDLATTVRACAELGLPREALADAESSALLTVVGDRVQFRHPLARSALYTTAEPALRRRLHEAAARALADGDPDRRVWHLSEAALGPDDDVAAELDRLAVRAAARTAYAVAATAADRAAVLSADRMRRARRELAAGTWAWHGGEPERSRLLLQSAVEESGSGVVHHRAMHLLGILAARGGAMDQARDLLLRSAAEAGEPVDALASLAEAVNACYYLGDASTALRVSGDIEALLDAAPVEARARGFIAAGCARILAGQDGSALIRSGFDALPVDQAGADPVLATWSVVGALFLRDADSGRELMDRVLGARRARSAIGELPHLLFHIARDEAASDRWDRAEVDYGEAISLARELGQSTELATSLAGLGWLEARRGRRDPCERYVGEALELAHRHRLHLVEVWARWAAADLALAGGDAELARQRYLAVEDRLATLGIGDVDLSPAPELVECFQRIGRPEAGAELAAAYAERAAAKGRPWALARAARTMAAFVDDDRVDTAYARALIEHDHTLDLFERARTLLAYGSRLRRGHRRVDSRPVLREAVDSFARLGARPWADAAGDELRATGAAVSRPGTSPVSTLTERERQIAVLITDGRTTRETAAALFVSPKTVEYHLRNTYTKLGVSSRAELRAVLADRS